MHKAVLILGALFSGFVLNFATPVHASDARKCDGLLDNQGEVVAIDGDVFAQSASGGRRKLSTGDNLCSGDIIETQALARIEFRLKGRDTTTGTAGNTTTVIPSEQNECVFIRRGVLAFISSVFTSHCVQTPLIDAGIDGTRAVIEVSEKTGDTIIVALEDRVRVTDRRGRAQSLIIDAGLGSNGNAAFATAQKSLTLASPENVPPSFRETYLNPENSVDWAIYYPPILLAIDDLNPSVQEAARLIDVGELASAEIILQALPEAGRNGSAALALRSIVKVAKNKPDEALMLAKAAVAADNSLSSAYIAESYAHQSGGNLVAARDSSAEATRMAPRDAYAWARLAELHLTIGDRQSAGRAVSRSLELQETALGLTIKGFSELAAIRLETAEASFRRAIKVDSEAPLPRLGLGLVEIRRGNLRQGRLEIETAVALDPNQASLRVWLGRAYLEEKRSDKAGTQLSVATRKDPDAPNAYLFEALRLFTENRPIEALDALENAETLGDTRAVIRSEAGLGEDRAVRSSATSRVLSLLQLDQLAGARGSRAAADDPSNPEAHRLLADVFSRTRGSETARTSETLRANLLSPPEKRASNIFLNEADLGLLEGAGPTQLTFSEFAPAFSSNGFLVAGNVIGGSQGTFGEEVSVSALHDRFSATAGQLYFTTDGFRDNNDLEHRVFQFQSTYAVTDDLTFFGEYRRRETNAGDRRLDFDLNDQSIFDPTFRSEFNRDTARIGFRADLDQKQDVVGVFTGALLKTSERGFDNQVGAFTDQIDEVSLDLQLQHIGGFADLKTVFGGSITTVDSDSSTIFSNPSFDDSFDDDNADQAGLYGYAYFKVPERFQWTVGASFDFYRESDSTAADRAQFNPKLGVEFIATPWLTVRGAYIQSLSKRLVSEQTIEPTTIAGFVQFEDTLNSVQMERFGVGFDARFGHRFWLGAEVTHTDFEFPIDGLETREVELHAYAGAALSDRIFLTLDGGFERVDSTFPFEFQEYEVLTARASLSYFSLGGFFARAEIEGVRNRILPQPSAGGQSLPASDSFALLNASLGYRLPNGRGSISVDVQNILNTDFKFQERNIRRDVVSRPRFARGFAIFGRASLRF